MEQWKEIKNYEGLYMVSNLGRIKRGNKILSANNNQRYIRICLCKDGANTVNNVRGNYPKFGIYKWAWKNGQGNSDITNRVVYFDNFKFYK